MSYILDALRKSDQQRRLGGVPTLPSVPAMAAASERSPLLLHGLFGLTLIFAAMTAIAWLRPWSPQPAVIAITAANPSPNPSTKLPQSSTKLPQSSPPQLPTPQLPTPQTASVVQPQAPATRVAEVPRPEPAAATAINPALVAPVSPRQPAASPAPEMRTPAPVSVAARPARAAIGKADESAGKTLSDAAPRSGSIASSALPASIRKQLPPLSVAVHAYSDIPQDRLVSINGRMLREGDVLAPDLRLEQITPEGMVFTFRGYRFQRAAQ